MAKNAKKKKLATSAGIPPVKKMIDLTEKEKSDPKAMKFANAVEKLFIRGVKKLNIPVCDMYATNPHLLTGYMIGRTRYLQFMDDSGAFLDQCLRDAIAQTVLDQMIRPELNKVVYPGKWDDFNLFALARSRVNIIIPSDRPELGSYLTNRFISPDMQITVGDMEGENALTFMRMSDYNPNRLYQFAILTGQVIMSIISTTIQSDIPFASLCNADERLVVRYGRELCEICNGTMQDWAANTLTNSAMTFVKKTEILCSKLYSPVMNYCAMLLGQSGIARSFVEALIDPEVADLNITQVTDEIESIDETNTCVQYRISAKDKTIKSFGTNELYTGYSNLTLNVGQLYRLCQMENPKKSDLATVGKEIKMFLEGLVTHAFSMYLAGALFVKRADAESAETAGEDGTSDTTPEMSMADEDPNVDADMGEIESPVETVNEGLDSDSSED